MNGLLKVIDTLGNVIAALERQIAEQQKTIDLMAMALKDDEPEKAQDASL